MLTALIAPIAGMLVATSTGIALNTVAQTVIPPIAKPLAGFAVKAGVAVVSGLVAGRFAQIVEDNVKSVVNTVTTIGAEEVEPTQEDN